MPPAAVRRPVTITTWVVLSALWLVLSPVLLALAHVAAAVIRRPQPVLLVRFATAYFALELRVLGACGLLWVTSGFGARLRSPRYRELHYRLLRQFVHALALRLCTLLDITIEPELEPEVERALEGDRPLLFFSRHAGPADTLLLIDMLLTRYGRLPSIVFKDTLEVDPSVDLIGHRLPHAILDTSDREAAEDRIEQVAASLDRRGILVLFPEGGNFTFERRRHALRRLWRKGHRQQARQAQRMAFVMPPQPGGTLAALRGSPNADVIFSAHTGLGLAAFPRELWRHTPIGGTLTVHMWRAPAGERPAEPDAQVEWLYGWWQRLNQWVREQGEEAQFPTPPGTAAPAMSGPT